MPPPRCSVSSACLQNGSRWSLKVKEVCSVSVGMGFMFGYYGGVRQVTPKLPCFNAPVTVRTNCFANKNETLPRLAGWMDTFNLLRAQLSSGPASGCVFWRGTRSGHLCGMFLLPQRAHRLVSALAIFFFSYSLLTSHLYPSSYRVFFSPKFKISLL